MRRAIALIASALLVAGCGLGDENGGEPTPQLILERAGDPEAPGDAPPPTFPATATANTIRVAGRNAIEDAAGVVSAVYPATAADDRPLAVTLVDADDWQGGVAAAVLASGEIGAPILITEDGEVPAVTAGTLARLDPRGAALAEESQVIRIGEDAAEPDDYETTIIEGDDPFEKAAAIDRFHSAAEGEPSPNVVIVSAEEPGYAMPAAAWAARSGDAVLFTEQGGLPQPTRQALEQHDDPNIFVLGPESVISPEVEEELGDLGAQVERIEGETPVETAIEFARFRSGDFGWGLVTPGHNYVLASITRPLDAAAGVPLAAGGTYAPLLLTDQTEELPDPLRGYFLDVQPGFEENPNQGVFNRAWILGDQDVISLGIQGQLDELLRLIPVEVPDDGDAGRRSPSRPPDRGPLDDLEPLPRPRDRGSDDQPDIPSGPGPIPAPQGPGIPLD